MGRSDLVTLVPFRFRLNLDALAALGVRVFRLPYWGAFEAFHKEVRERNDLRNLPTRAFNSALLTLSPTLIHGIHYKTGTLLALDDPAITPPSPELIWEVSTQFARSLDLFYGDVSATVRKPALNVLMESLSVCGQWQSVSALEALSSSDYADLRYRAIPSLLAACLNGRQMTLSHGKSVHWGVAQDADTNRLVAVSDPQLSDEEPNDPFAYKLEFSIQYEVQDPTPWIHAFLRCRRYANDVKRKNFGRDVTVMVQSGCPRRSGWPYSVMQVPVRLEGSARTPHYERLVAEIITAAKGRSLPDPIELLSKATHFRSPNEHGDSYYVVYAEGLRPHHRIKTGFGASEREEVVLRKVCAELMGDLLQPGKVMLPDKESIPKAKPAMLCAPKELAAAPTRLGLRRGATDDERQHFIRGYLDFALRRSLRDQPVCLLIVYHMDNTRKGLEDHLRTLLHLSAGDPWPAWLTVKPVVAEGDLAQWLDRGHEVYEDRFTKKGQDRAKALDDWTRQMRRAEQHKLGQWKAFLEQHIPEDGYCLALIELSADTDWELGEKAERSIHDAVHKACLELGIHAQMIRPIESDYDEIKNAPYQHIAKVAEPQARLDRAVHDLMLRQTGAAFGTPAAIYRQAGLPDDLIDGLSVVGLCQVKNYAFAVRFRPNGRAEGLAMETGNEWLPFLEAKLQLGELIARDGSTNRRKKPTFARQNQLIAFAKWVLTSVQEPTAVMLVANDWRSLWPQMKVGSLRYEEFLFGNDSDTTHHFTPVDRPDLRIVWLREIQDGETPQYIGLKDDEVMQVERACLFKPTDNEADDRIYYSVGDVLGHKPAALQRRQRLFKHNSGGTEAMKSQSLVGIVPFFCQPGDSPVWFARIAHLMRHSPAWDTGTLLFPYPVHLGNATIDDMLCLRGEEG